MKTPNEFNPYQTMVDLLLLEAQEMDADQILLISRPEKEKASLYFVSEERVTRRIELQTDLTPDFLDQLTRTEMNVSHKGQTTPVHVRLAHSAAGNCISMTLRKQGKNQPEDVDRTIPIPRIEMEEIANRPVVFKIR